MSMNQKNTQNLLIIKSGLRKRFLVKRQTLEKGFVDQASKTITKKLFTKIKKLKPSNILVYLSVNNEVETKAIIDYLTFDGKRIFLPKFAQNTPGVKLGRHSENTPGVKNASGYFFAAFTGWGNLEPESYGILQPTDSWDTPGVNQVVSSHTPGVSIDLAIIPGVAFDKSGVRLGYGKGVFDKLLADSKAFKIGLAYDFQIVDKLPKEAHDLVMDMVVTEKRLIDHRS